MDGDVRVGWYIPPEETRFLQLPICCLDRAGMEKRFWRIWLEDILEDKSKYSCYSVCCFGVVWVGLVLVADVCVDVKRRSHHKRSYEKKNENKTQAKSREKTRQPIYFRIPSSSPPDSKCGVVTHNIQAMAGIEDESLLDWHWLDGRSSGNHLPRQVV